MRWEGISNKQAHHWIKKIAETITSRLRLLLKARSYQILAEKTDFNEL